jgi:hypothetical protein
MNSLFAKSSLCKLATAVVFTSTALIITGCGMGSPAGSSTITAGAIQGDVHGGAAPIVGATIQIWETGTIVSGSVTGQGYGTATMVQEALAGNTGSTPGVNGSDTDGTGSFSFLGGYTCPAGQYVYLVSTGGNAGGVGVNSGAVLVDALGRCEDVFSGSTYVGQPININEATTVAAAYALGHFTGTFSSINGTGAGTAIGIGSDATNNAPKIGGVSTGCTGTTLNASCTGTATAGLAHAFQNANNLVEPYGGVARAVLASTAGLTVPATVPQALINSIANILSGCVNSNGSAAACTTLYSATTIGSNIPANTFSAMVNLALNPTLGGSGTAVTNLYGLSTPASAYFAPALTTATGLTDYSLAVNFPATFTGPASLCSGTCNGLIFPTSAALDMNDDVYICNENSTTSPTGSNFFSLSSNGNPISVTANGAVKQCLNMALDTIGNGYGVGGSASSGNGGLKYTYNSSGVVTAPATITSATNLYELAIDQHNNVWAESSAGNLYEGTGVPATTFNVTAAAALALGTNTTGRGLSIDADQNIWAAGGQVLAVWPNTGSIATPAYAGSVVVGSSAPSASLAAGISFEGTAAAFTAYVGSYQPGSVGVQPYTPTLGGTSTNTVTAATSGTEFTSGAITGQFYGNVADGDGTIWLGDTNGVSLTAYNPVAGTAYRYKPCVVTSQACATGFGTTGKPQSVSVDSAGSIWVPATTNGNVLEIIGAAAPTWPQVSLGKPGGIPGGANDRP